MEEPTDESLEQRVERLEATVTDLRAHVSALREALKQQSASDVNDAGPLETAVPRDSTTEPSPSVGARLRDRVEAAVTGSTEDWLNRVGIALLLFGLAFLFKYSIDQGWLGPVVRVAFGAGLGAVLLWGGIRTAPSRRALSQVLFGGSCAAFYTTVFAAHQLYLLIPHPVAFAGMTAITVGTFVLAVREDGAALAVIGALGGLGTPFVLQPGMEGSIPGLVGYTVLLLGGMVTIYLYRGWRTLLYTSAAGGWLVLLTTVAQVAFGDGTVLNQWAVQGGVVAAWLLLGGVPVGRAILRQKNPERWPQPELPQARWLRPLLRTPPAFALVSASPLLAYTASRILWHSPSDALWGIIALAGMGGYGVAYVSLTRRSVSRYAPAHAVVAAVLGAVGLTELLDGSTLLVAWSVEVLALHAAARHLDAPVLRWSGHAFAVLVAAVWANQVEVVQPGVQPVLHPDGLSELGALGLMGVASWLVPSAVGRRLYRGGVLAGWLAWSWQEFAALPNGDAYVSAVWGITALGLLLTAVRQRSRARSYAAFGTLALFVAKLFLVDLARLSALSRIFLFVGFGTVFLGISYLLPGLWLNETDEN